MVVFSVSNVITKLFFNSIGSQEINLDLIGKLSSTQFLMIGGIALLTIIGALAFLSAINAGKPALVMAIVSLSTVLMAILSVMFLGDQFTLKEMVGMALATISIIILAL